MPIAPETPERGQRAGRPAAPAAVATLAAALLLPALFLLPAAPAEEASFTEVALKIVPSVEFKFRTPKDGVSMAGTVRGNWIDVTGGTTPLRGLKGGPIRFEPRQTLLAVDLDGDGQYEGTVRQDVFPVKTAREGGVTAPYVFRLRHDYEKWYFQRACMAQGEIDKTPVQFIDDNNDGAFNSLGSDVVHVGKAFGAGYLGKLLPVKGKLYEIEVDSSGTRLLYRPFDPGEGKAPGTLDLFTGYRARGKPSIAVVRKTDDPHMLFDCAVKGGVPVPPGEYELMEAIMGPTREQMCVVTNGRMNPIVVQPGATTTVEWGTPGTFDFSCEKNGALLTMSSGSVKIYGRGGELYEKFEPTGIPIQVEVTEEATGKRVWFGPIENLSQGVRMPTTLPYVVRLLNDNVPYLGPFQSEWQ